jgi:hypothetical protein
MTLATGDLRNHARKRVLMQASIISAHGTHRARINDLHVSGVRVSCEPPLEKDTDVIFKRGKLFVAARVAWTARGGAGLEFYRPPASPAEPPPDIIPD